MTSSEEQFEENERPGFRSAIARLCAWLLADRFSNGFALALCLSTLLLLTFGLVMLASAGWVNAHYGDPFYYVKRQAMWVGMGLLACLVTARLDYRLYRKLAWPLFIAAGVLLVWVLVVGKEVNGARRWLVAGPFRFQPSEFAKYVLVIILAYWFEKAHRRPKGGLLPKIQHCGWGIFAPIAITFVLVVLVLVAPDFGTTVLLGLVALILMWVAGAPSGWLAGIVGTLAAGIAGLWVAIFRYGMFLEFYQVRRIVHWWLGDDLYGINYQQTIAKLAFGWGDTWGLGLGNSRMKLGFLPEAHTDFILPIIGEEMGLGATLAIVLTFSVLVVSGLVLAARSPDVFGRLLASGIMVVLGLQAMVNIAVVTNTLPNKGMPLPFISYGGSGLVLSLAAVGVVLSVFRQTDTYAADVLGNRKTC